MFIFRYIRKMAERRQVKRMPQQQSAFVRKLFIKTSRLLTFLLLLLMALAACGNSSDALPGIDDEGFPNITQPMEPPEKENERDPVKAPDFLPQTGYGYANADGDKIIVLLAEMDDMNNNKLLDYFTYAIGENGKSYGIEYNAYQERGEKNNNRDTMQNFDNQAGCVYNVIGSPAVPNDTYILLSTEEYKNIIVLQAEEAQGATIALEGLLNKCAELANRKAINGWELSLYQNGIRISMVEFESKGDGLLAWMAMEGEDVFGHCEFPAEMDDSYTGWAMGDQGKLNQDGNRFRVLCALQNDQGIAVYFSWYAEEGEVIKKVEFFAGETPNEKTVSGRYLLT